MAAQLTLHVAIAPRENAVNPHRQDLSCRSPHSPFSRTGTFVPQIFATSAHLAWMMKTKKKPHLAGRDPPVKYSYSFPVSSPRHAYKRDSRLEKLHNLGH